MAELTLYISPHLDDVVLSCAGRIHAQVLRGEKVGVVTPLAGDPATDRIPPLAQELHSRFRLGDRAIADRRQEDLKSCRRLRVDFRHGPFLEAIYRMNPVTGEALYGDLGSLFGAVHACDEAALPELIGWLKALPVASEVVVPLAVGGHVDHAWVRRACEICFPFDRILYYEDYPYAQRFGAVPRVVRPRNAWRSERVRMDADARRVKCDAIADHESQAWSIFRDRADLERKVRWFTWRRGGGERYWRRVR